MTNEEFEPVKDSHPPRVLLEETAQSRKLNRDMDRLERVLRKIVSAPKDRKSRSDQRRVESEKAYEQRRAEIRENRARSDAKFKALTEELQIPRDKPPQS